MTAPVLMKCFSVLTLFLILFSCTEGFQETNSGISFKTVRSGDTTQKAQDKTHLLFDILVKTSTDSVLYSTRKSNTFFHVRYDTYAQKLMKANPLQDLFFEMRKGDSTIFKVKPSDITFISPDADNLGDETVYCHVSLVDILEYEAYSQWQKGQMKKRAEARNRTIVAQAALEAVAIDSLLESQGSGYQISPSGIRYIIENEGNGKYPEKGDSLYYHYEVTYLNGEVLPGAIGRSGKNPQYLVMGSKGTIRSWQESLMLLKEGGAGKFYFPPVLAFGEAESYGVKPNAVLVANIRLIELKTAK